MKVLLYGSGRLGQQVLHLLNQHFAADYTVIGFVDDTRPGGEAVAGGYRTLGALATVAANPTTAPDHALLVPAIGYGNLPARGRALERARVLGYRFPTLVHPRAWLEPGTALGQGVIVLAGVLIDQAVHVGDCCYLDQGVKLGEECVLGANNYLAAGATLGGGVRLGRDNFLGLDVTVTDGVVLGDGNFVNAKTLVYKDLGDRQRLVEFHEQARLPLEAAETACEVSRG
jgi:UDP-3-O-[3-hydroxymyristoyl] glucosamine N-acyltransferase